MPTEVPTAQARVRIEQDGWILDHVSSRCLGVETWSAGDDVKAPRLTLPEEGPALLYRDYYDVAGAMGNRPISKFAWRWEEVPEHFPLQVHEALAILGARTTRQEPAADDGDALESWLNSALRDDPDAINNPTLLPAVISLLARISRVQAGARLVLRSEDGGEAPVLVLPDGGTIDLLVTLDSLYSDASDQMATDLLTGLSW